ncbi:uncharacterized protein DS421_13g403050 [Arachis hypogaea]|nr:uncharacterized protein DS421_13g403050 [Arachis hypogaea]
MNEELNKEINMQEVKEAVFSMGSLKAPGLDGLNGLFYQKYWHIIQEDVLAVVQNFFDDGTIPKDINETIVVLIPKVDNPENLNRLRPISCCNFIYKIISRILVIRLKRILDIIVSPIQSAFVGGRMIQDNIVIVQEAFHKIGKKGREGMEDLAIKLDMNKAYDRLEWDFLEEVLKAFGFCQKWVKMMMSCVTGANYRFKVNGKLTKKNQTSKLTKKIKPQRGLRQGDPLSPYLFIIAAEVFTILMNRAEREGDITGMKLAPNAPNLTHLLFADDCIIFSKAREEDIYQLIQILNVYTEASGQRINLDKSGIIFGNHVSINTRVQIEEILGISTWDNPGKYLGLPAKWGRSKMKALEWIEDKVNKKIEGWKEKLLNQAGKEILIKAVIQAIPSYVMNVVKLPKSFCKKLEGKIAKFWWAGSGKERGTHWISWKRMTKSKKDGGLGFRNLENQNIAYLAKQAWRLVKNPEVIWAKILKEMYFPDGNFWEAKAKNGDSWVWRSLVEGKDFIRRNGRWSIGDGSNIDIWKDNWIIEGGSIKNYWDNRISMVKDLLVEGGGWNEELLRQVFPPNIKDKILSTPISLINKEDCFFWPHRLDGNYTIKSGYYIAKYEERVGEDNWASSSDNFKEVWSEIWKMQIPNKIKIFLWKASHNIIAVNYNLWKRKITNSPICRICRNGEESVEHAILLCPWTRPTWFGAQIQAIPTDNSIRTFAQWLLETINRIKQEGKKCRNNG